MRAWLLLALGGALGAVGRHIVVSACEGMVTAHLGPAGRRAAGTLLVNVAGSGLAGLGWALWAQAALGAARPFVGMGAGSGAWGPAYAFGVLGFCGALTTFSGFAVDARRLRAERGLPAAAAYTGGTFGLCAAAWHIGQGCVG